MPTYKKTQDGVNGCVYFFRISGTNHVFIGTSTTNNPRMRYGQLSRLIPYKLDLVGWIRTGQFLDMQKRLCYEFAYVALLNGWYNLPPDVLSATFSRESGASVSEVREMVLNGIVVALDGKGVLSTDKISVVKRFMDNLEWDSNEVSFADTLRGFRVLVDGSMTIGEFKKEICSLGYKMTCDNKGFFTKRS